MGCTAHAQSVVGTKQTFLPEDLELQNSLRIAHETSQGILGSVFSRTDFFADFNFWAAGFFSRSLGRWICSPHFCGEKVTRKILQDNPQQNLHNKNP